MKVNQVGGLWSGAMERRKWVWGSNNRRPTIYKLKIGLALAQSGLFKCILYNKHGKIITVYIPKDHEYLFETEDVVQRQQSHHIKTDQSWMICNLAAEKKGKTIQIGIELFFIKREYRVLCIWYLSGFILYSPPTLDLKVK